MKHLVLAVLLVAGTALPILAQPTWRFHIAFEDGTGARDTIWMVYDLTATVGSGSFPTVDYSLGEGAVAMDPNAFNVWVYNWDSDSTKTVAFPYTEFPYHNATVHAFNFQYPVTIRWDLSLGSEPWLPQNNWPIDYGFIYNSYFFYINNIGQLGYFDMSVVDSVVVEDPSPNVLFPADFTLGHRIDLAVPERAVRELRITPNPAHDRTFIKCEPTVRYDLHLIDVHGGAVLRTVFTGSTDLELGVLSAGIYLCRIAGSDGSMTRERLVIGR